MDRKTNKFENIQALRGVAVLMVLLFHVHALEAQYYQREILSNFFDLGTAGVDIFFVISGFIMVQVTRGKFQKPDEIIYFLLHRLTRIYPLYWFYSLLLIVVFLIQPNWIHHVKDQTFSMIKSFLLLPQPTGPLLNVGWSLVHELYFYSVICLILFFPEKILLFLLGAWAILVMISHIIFSFSSPMLLLMTHPLTMEFIAGCSIAQFYNSSGKKSWAWFILIVGLCLFLIVGYLHLLPGEIRDGWARIFVFGIPSMLVVLAGVLLEKKSILFPHFLRRLGDASYSIYLSHALVLSALGRLYSAQYIHTTYAHLLGLLLEVIVALVVGICSFRYLEKPLLVYFSSKVSKLRFNFLNNYSFANKQVSESDR